MEWKRWWRRWWWARHRTCDGGGGDTSFLNSSAEYPACRRVLTSYPLINSCLTRHPPALRANASESNGNSCINDWAPALLSPSLNRHFCCSVKTALCS